MWLARIAADAGDVAMAESVAAKMWTVEGHESPLPPHLQRKQQQQQRVELLAAAARSLARQGREAKARALPPESHLRREFAGIAGAARRAGRDELYQEFRAPLATQVTQAEGAASRLSPAFYLLGFDIITRNLDGAVAGLRAMPDQEKQGAFMMLLRVMAPEMTARLSLPERRTRLTIVAHLVKEMGGDPRTTSLLLKPLPAGAQGHSRAGEGEAWLTWSYERPTTEARAMADVAMGAALVAPSP